MAGRLERIQRCRRRLIVTQPQINEQPVIFVRIRRAQRLADNWQDANSPLACALGDELFDPVAETLEGRRDGKCQLVQTPLGQSAQYNAEFGGFILTVRNGRAAGLRSLIGPAEKSLDIYSDQRGRQQAEVGQGGISSADIGVVQECVAESELSRQLCQTASRGGDGNEMFAGSVLAQAVDDTVVEECHEREGLNSAPGFRGDDEEGA